MQVEKLANRRLSIGGLCERSGSSDGQENSSGGSAGGGGGARTLQVGRFDIGRTSAPPSSWAAGRAFSGGGGGGAGATQAAAMAAPGAFAGPRRASADVGAASNGWTTAAAAHGQQVRQFEFSGPAGRHEVLL